MAKVIQLKPVEKKKIDLRSSGANFEKNPFIVNLKGKMYLQPKPNTIIAKGEHIVDTITGEILEDSVLMGRRKVVDRSQFAKIYFSQIQSIFDLSKGAVKVLMYIAEHMDYTTKVIVNAKQQAKKMGYKSQQTVQNALRELMNCGIIAQGPVGGVYWVNPLYICKGERFAMYLEYTTKEYNENSEKRKAEIQAQLDEQTLHMFDTLDEHTSAQIDAMDKRAELAWSIGEEEFAQQFPGMSGEKRNSF